MAADEHGTNPAGKGQAPKDAPGKSLSIGPDVDGQGEEAARDKGPEAAAQGGQGLGDAVEGAETGVGRGRIRDLPRLVSSALEPVTS